MKETKLQVQKIINLQNVTNNLPDAFTDYKGVTKSWNPMVNAPERVEVPKKTTHAPSIVKMGRVAQTKKDKAPNKRPRKEKMRSLQKIVNVSQPTVDRHLVNIPQSSTEMHYRNENASTLENPDALVLGNHEASTGIQKKSINYTSFREVYAHSTTIVNPCFSTIIVENFLADPDPMTMAECKRRSNWNRWKEAIEPELNSLKKRKVFADVILTPPRTFPVGFKWVFIQKRNENNEVLRYKARLVAQGFTQRPDIDFNETYSPVMNGITFRYLISLAIQNHLSLQLMVVVTTYLYESLDSNIYMKVPNGIPVLNVHANHNMYCVMLVKLLYGSKQSGRMWYNQLKEFLVNKSYSSNDDFLCVFIRKSTTGFCIISVYVDDLNIIGHTKDVDEARNHLKIEFKMKDMDKTKFCLDYS
jgi:hypothetical protein